VTLSYIRVASSSGHGASSTEKLEALSTHMTVTVTDRPQRRTSHAWKLTLNVREYQCWKATSVIGRYRDNAHWHRSRGVAACGKRPSEGSRRGIASTRLQPAGGCCESPSTESTFID
jgi:hypothetical protein